MAFFTGLLYQWSARQRLKGMLASCQISYMRFHSLNRI